MLKVRTDKYEIWESGVILIKDNERFEFVIYDDKEFAEQNKHKSDYKDHMIVQCVFLKDTFNNEPQLSYDVVNDNTGRIIFINFDKGIHGVTNLKPIDVGIRNGRRLLLDFRIVTYGEKDLSFYYNWYIGEEV